MAKKKDTISDAKRNIIKTVKKQQKKAVMDKDYDYGDAGNNGTEEEVVVEENKLLCVQCGDIRSLTRNFYISYNSMHPKKRIPYCKPCIRGMLYDKLGNIMVDKAKKFLQMIDRPYIWDLWDKSFTASDGDGFGIYMKNIALPQYRFFTWNNSEFEPSGSVMPSHVSSFELTDYIIAKWGTGYDREEYENFERKYGLLKNNYLEKTAMHTEALLNYIRYRVKEEMATAKGDVREAKEWGGLAQKAATDAKINPNQLSQADLQDGLSTFGQLTRAVEQAVDIIPILPVFKEKPQDKIDFAIWCYINYIRDLTGLPLCEYKDVYEFYNQRKMEFEKELELDELESTTQ